MQMNNFLMKIIEDYEIELSYIDSLELSSELASLLKEGFRVSEKTGCIYFSRCKKYETEELLDNTYDLTGAECALNDIAIDDHVEGSPKFILLQGFSFAKKLSVYLKGFSSQACKVILTFDGEYCTVRFHQERDNENWLSDDINSSEDGVAII